MIGDNIYESDDSGDDPINLNPTKDQLREESTIRSAHQSYTYNCKGTMTDMMFHVLDEFKECPPTIGVVTYIDNQGRIMVYSNLISELEILGLLDMATSAKRGMISSKVVED